MGKKTIALGGIGRPKDRPDNLSPKGRKVLSDKAKKQERKNGRFV